MNAIHVGMNGPIKSVRVPKSDVETASAVIPPRQARTENSRRFAIMGAAILEKLCRSGNLSVYAKRTTPYVLDTTRGRVALAAMVSTVAGDLTSKHMVVPMTSLAAPPGVSETVFVCAFVSKRERTRETNGGINVKLAGWATLEEVAKYARDPARVATRVEIAAIPVSQLHPIQTLRYYLSPSKQNQQGEQSCENHA